jgi:hypothetical protein
MLLKTIKARAFAATLTLIGLGLAQAAGQGGSMRAMPDHAGDTRHTGNAFSGHRHPCHASDPCYADNTRHAVKISQVILQNTPIT